MKALNYALFACSLMILINGCSKNKDDNKPKEFRLIKMFSDTYESSFTYNSNGLIESETYVYKADTRNNRTYQYTYDQEKRLISYTSDIAEGADSKFELSYKPENGKLDLIKEFNKATGILIGTLAFTYEPRKVKAAYTPAGAEVTDYSLFILTEDEKNVIEVRNFAMGYGEISVFSYSDYDQDKKAPETFLPNKSGQNFWTNPFGTCTISWASGGSSTFTNTYEYNPEGYPTKITDDDGFVTSYEYAYQ